MNVYVNLFATSFLQVFLVAVNTIFLSKGFIPGIAICSFMISYLWVTNVKKANIATKAQTYVYATGAMTGGLTGFFFTKFIFHLLIII